MAKQPKDFNDPEQILEEDVPSSTIYTYKGKESKLQKLPCKREPGMSYIWARKDVRGVDDHRVEDLESEGWQMVEKDKSTSNTVLGDPLGRNPLAARFYTYKDTILMKIPTDFIEAYHRQLSKENRDKMRAIPATITDDSPFTYGFGGSDGDQ